MKIIDRIEIRYFRSIYNVTIAPSNDVNIFVGANDAGKSNIVKTLNLFFNNQTDFNSDFDFLADLSRPREDEVRAAKGRATIWIKVTFNNFLGWKSLPDKFSIKRVWNRYSSTPADTYPRGVPGVTIGKFLNKISFHYIPAVRGRDIYAHYLSQLHDSLIEDEKAGVRDASDVLMAKINESTTDMSQRIGTGLGFKSQIQVPEDLRDLFRALDFSTEFSGYQIPLQRRGDGIQGRHIPFILDFIARHSKNFHIWAYEEPENSLEMSGAFDLAKQFVDEFSEENQIYITTHSPAFYDLSGSKVSKWFVQSGRQGDEAQLATTASTVSASEAADRRLGIAALVAQRSRELYDENETLKRSVDRLEDQVSVAERPQIIVEGPTDQIILGAAVLKYRGDDGAFCEFLPAEGASNVGSFIKTAARVQHAVAVPIIGLVDNDSAGRKEYEGFRKRKFHEGSKFRVVNQTSQVYFGILSIPEELEDVDRIIREISGDDFGIPLSIEFMFPRDIVLAAIDAGVLVLRDRFAKARGGELGLIVNVTEIFSPRLPEGYQYFAKEIDQQCKAGFAEWVCNLDAGAFENFRPLLDTLIDIAQPAD